jgi:hypothetical protein
LVKNKTHKKNGIVVVLSAKESIIIFGVLVKRTYICFGYAPEHYTRWTANRAAWIAAAVAL